MLWFASTAGVSAALIEALAIAARQCGATIVLVACCIAIVLLYYRFHIAAIDESPHLRVWLFSGRHEIWIFKSWFAVSQRLAIERTHTPAGRAKHGMAGCNVPLHGTTKARIEISCAFGKATKFQR
jgi:hypothetical protein